MSDKVTLDRPEGISDDRWAAMLGQATLVLTGHAPWCDDHQQDTSERPEDGWCHRTFTSFACEVDISNGTTDGHASISLYLPPGVREDNLTLPQAAAIGSVLEQAVVMAKWGNLNGSD